MQFGIKASTRTDFCQGCSSSNEVQDANTLTNQLQNQSVKQMQRDKPNVTCALTVFPITYLQHRET